MKCGKSMLFGEARENGIIYLDFLEFVHRQKRRAELRETPLKIEDILLG